MFISESFFGMALFPTLKINSPPPLFRSVIALAAFNGMLSEYLLGHLMALTWGSVYKQYALTMGLFVLSMGIGAWKFRSYRQPIKNFVKILSLYIFFILLAFITTKASLDSPPSQSLLLGQLCLILCLGFLSGAELPLLEQIQKQSRSDSSVSYVLIWDYLGMALGSLFFGFYLLQAWGVVGTLILICLLHLLMISWALIAKIPKGETQ